MSDHAPPRVLQHPMTRSYPIAPFWIAQREMLDHQPDDGTALGRVVLLRCLRVHRMNNSTPDFDTSTT
ncbi:MAG TPA: hypothetical protein VFW03_22120 [Gemmatimonadaceae bacterium]|nr:hypothetical protein [Gemmatimonadaceae bacterium]